MLEIKSTITKMKSVFYGIISRLNMPKEIIPELKDISIEKSKTEKQKEKRIL